MRYDAVMGFWARAVIWSARRTLLFAIAFEVLLMVMGLVKGRGIAVAFDPSVLFLYAFMFCLSLAFLPLKLWASKADKARQEKYREIEAKFRKARLDREARARDANSCNSTEGPAI
jgi:hypothetical protein